MPIDVVVPEKDRKVYESWHFAPAVRHGDLVFVSGVIGRGETPDLIQVGSKGVCRNVPL